MFEMAGWALQGFVRYFSYVEGRFCPENGNVTRSLSGRGWRFSWSYLV
jgi:hypothetical protein